MLVKKIEFRKPLNTAASKHIKLYNNDYFNINQEIIDKIDLICYDSFNLPILNNEEYDDGEGPVPQLETPMVLFNFKISYSKDGKNWYKLYNNFEEDLSKCIFLFGGYDSPQNT